MRRHLVNDVGAGHVPDLHVGAAGSSILPRPGRGEPGIRAQGEENLARGWRQLLRFVAGPNVENVKRIVCASYERPPVPAEYNSAKSSAQVERATKSERRDIVGGVFFYEPFLNHLAGT